MFDKLVCFLFWFVFAIEISLIMVIHNPNMHTLTFGSAFQGLTKTIPGSPAGQPQVHEKLHPIYKPVQK
jgi:hypothetical protein